MASQQGRATKMNVLVTSDLHLTDNPRDADRWNLFPWLAKQAKKYSVSHILILGDLTEAHDRHSSVLVNRVCSAIYNLPGIKIVLKGNHDFIDQNNPFWGFFKTLQPSNVHYVAEPEFIKVGKLGECLFLPCTRNWQRDWQFDFKACHNFIFTHQSYDGAIAETGYTLDGIPPSVFKGTNAKIISGDVHKPQMVGKRIEYVGAPYRTRFGDDYTPRVMLINSKENIKDLHYPGKNKILITCNGFDLIDRRTAYLAVHGFDSIENNEDPKEGDQLKIRVRLKRSQYHEWPSIRSKIQDWCKYGKYELCGLELVERKPKKPNEQVVDTNIQKPMTLLKEYADKHNLKSTVRKTGLTLLREAKHAT